MKVMELAVTQEDNWRNIAISLIPDRPESVGFIGARESGMPESTLTRHSEAVRIDTLRHSFRFRILVRES
jgi:hypothetical protein